MRTADFDDDNRNDLIFGVASDVIIFSTSVIKTEPLTCHRNYYNVSGVCRRASLIITMAIITIVLLILIIGLGIYFAVF